MVKKKSFLFVGNRGHVLQKMQDMGCDIIDIYCPRDSYLARELSAAGTKFQIFDSKNDLLDMIGKSEFDVLISNGCPYILPISKLQAQFPAAQFINVHPSVLPSLKGPHPATGAILHNVPAGATCHFMIDDVDEGAIIAQKSLEPGSHREDGYLQMLLFRLEADVFQMALEHEFKSGAVPVVNDPAISSAPQYYKRTQNDAVLLAATMSAEQIIARIRAFSDREQGAYFTCDGVKIYIRSSEIIGEPQLEPALKTARNGQILLRWANGFCMKIDGRILKCLAHFGQKIPSEGCAFD